MGLFNTNIPSSLLRLYLVFHQYGIGYSHRKD